MSPIRKPARTSTAVNSAGKPTEDFPVLDHHDLRRVGGGSGDGNETYTPSALGSFSYPGAFDVRSWANMNNGWAERLPS